MLLPANELVFVFAMIIVSLLHESCQVPKKTLAGKWLWEGFELEKGIVAES